jgi:hypothetical protein
VRHRTPDGRRLVEPARPGALHLFELARGPTAATTPALAVEVHVVGQRVRVVHWLMGEPFWVVAVSGQA